MAIIKLKRARNSLLNVSKFPPEILGEIFRHNTAFHATYFPSMKRPHNFLLVCHHWFEVASHTPELWGFWGRNPQDWIKRYLQYPTAPLNLVLDDEQSDSTNVTLDDNLRNAPQTRAMQDTIQQIRLVSGDWGILNSIISSLTGHEEIRSSSVESVDLRFEDFFEPPLPIVSDFLANYYFPKLQRLELHDCTIPSWDLKTSALTNLKIYGQFPSFTITSSQILSILRSNPLLRCILLDVCAVPNDSDVKSSRVPLIHLTELSLSGYPQDILALLHQLDCPVKMDSLFLNMAGDRVRVDDTLGIVGPYLRDYVRRRGRSQSGLAVSIQTLDGLIKLSIGDTKDFSLPSPDAFHPFAEVEIYIGQDLSGEDSLDFIPCVLREEITYLMTTNVPVSTEAISTRFPSIKGMHFSDTPLRVAFPDSNLDQVQISSSLRYIRVGECWEDGVDGRDWNLLANFLDRIASSGNRLDKLDIEDCCDIDPEVEMRIAGAVREFMEFGC